MTQMIENTEERMTKMIENTEGRMNKMIENTEGRMTKMIENTYQATKSDIEATKNELLLSQARLEIRIMEKIGSLKQENGSAEVTRVEGTDGVE